MNERLRDKKMRMDLTDAAVDYLAVRLALDLALDSFPQPGRAGGGPELQCRPVRTVLGDLYIWLFTLTHRTMQCAIKPYACTSLGPPHARVSDRSQWVRLQQLVAVA